MEFFIALFILVSLVGIWCLILRSTPVVHIEIDEKPKSSIAKRKEAAKAELAKLSSGDASGMVKRPKKPKLKIVD